MVLQQSLITYCARDDEKLCSTRKHGERAITFSFSSLIFQHYRIGFKEAFK